MQYIRLNTNKKYINAIYNTNKIINKYKNLLLRFGSVLKRQSEIRSDHSGFSKTTSKHIQKYLVFCGFWIGLRFYFGSVWI